MRLLLFVGAFVLHCSLVSSSDYPSKEDLPGISPYGAEAFLDDNESQYPFGSDVDFYSKRAAFPKWHHGGFSLKRPLNWAFVSPAMAERKRFIQPFHPLARFRGMSLGGGSSRGGGMLQMPYHSRNNFDSFVPSPSHPIPSDLKLRTYDEGEEALDANKSSPLSKEEDLKAGDILRFLTSVSNDRGPDNRQRLFRFGIK